MYQARNDYPTLHLMITNNAVYLKQGLVLDNEEEVLEKVREWLRRNLK